MRPLPTATEVIDRFLLSRPCIEEVEGFMRYVVLQRDDPELRTAGSSFDGMTTEVMEPLQDYLDRLKRGRDVPEASFMTRSYDYVRGKPPVKRRVLDASQP